jgi:hypothetical protein
MKTAQQQSNDLRTAGDSAGQTFEQRYNQLLKAFRAFVGHPVLESHHAELIGQAWLILLSDIQMLVGYPDGEIQNLKPLVILRRRLHMAFLRFLNHPDTSEGVAHFYTSLAKSLPILSQ